MNNISPFEQFFCQNPNHIFLKVFGCRCFPCLKPYDSDKLEARSISYTLLDYSPHHKGYNCLSDTGEMYITSDVIFEETYFPFANISKENVSSLISKPSQTILHVLVKSKINSLFVPLLPLV